jgi:hypothetical protein
VTATVEVRHAGGTVTVETTEFLEQAVVALSFPGFSVPLYPAEAVRLSVELIAAAHRAEHPASDEWVDAEPEPPC